jgi:hypothetical protein
MRGRGSKSSNNPEASGLSPEALRFTLTPAGKRALAELGTAAKRQAERHDRLQKARERGHRCGTVSTYWRDNEAVPQVRLSGNWLQQAGFELGREFEIGVEPGVLVVRVV